MRVVERVKEDACAGYPTVREPRPHLNEMGGVSADAVLNSRKAGWFENAAIVKLNLILLLSMISSYATGFDGRSVLLPVTTSAGGQRSLEALRLCLPVLHFKEVLKIAPLVSIYNALYSTGAVAAAWITYGTFRMSNNWAWRIPSILQSLSSVLQILLCWCVEESPRWLVAKDRVGEAQGLITKYHAAGNTDDPFVALEIAEIREALRLEKEASESSSYLSFFQTQGNRHRFFIILAVGFFSQWSGNGLVSYYLTLILDSIGYKSEASQTLINALLQIWNLVWGIAFALIVNRFGRRVLFLTSTIGILLVYIVWTALEATYEKETDLTGAGSHGVAKGVLAMIFLYSFFFSIGWGPLQVTYVVEILPYNLRARGLVLYNLFVALALIFNQYVNPVGVTNSKWKSRLYNTGGKSLEETAALLDGEDAAEKLQENAKQVAEEIIIHVVGEKREGSEV
ncbi:hypothetical protein SLS56_010986 [Neofusicoccum ribis]|uniref:Major facilitator superfamily (MFS) profile domain-containing protein n=1 Tax=Neofusicoccum ribis TaxID=45134 RepID=A0ABR3SCZ7_9PEZI